MLPIIQGFLDFSSCLNILLTLEASCLLMNGWKPKKKQTVDTPGIRQKIEL